MASPVIFGLRYHDLAAAIGFLERAFGFERHLVIDDEQGNVTHAQLTLGSGMLMLGPAQTGDDALMATVRQSGGKPTAAPYIVLGDLDGHAARAREEGAEIVVEPKQEDYGGKLYSCRDPEGNLWNFGTYDPWAQG